MKKYGAEVIHFASGLLAGYPPCPYIDTFVKYTEEVTGLEAVVGTHPMPTNYIDMHSKLGDWTPEHLQMLEEFSLTILEESELYNSNLPDYVDRLNKEL